MRLFLVLLALASLSAAGPRAQAPVDPFLPGLRWTHPASPVAPWLPRDVAFAAGGELVWAAPTLANPHLLLLAAGEVASPAPELHASGPPTGAIGVVETAANGADGLFAAAQFPDPVATSRRTEVYRYDGLGPGQGLPFAAVWTHDVGLKTNGPVRLELDPSGTVLAAAVHDAANGVVQVDLLDPASGALAARRTVAGNALRSILLSEGGALLAVAAGLDLWVLDAGGQTVHHEILASATDDVPKCYGDPGHATGRDRFVAAVQINNAGRVLDVRTVKQAGHGDAGMGNCVRRVLHRQ